jgi:hypothetical protein
MGSLPYVSLQRDGDGTVLLESSDGVRLRLIARSAASLPLKSWKTADRIVIIEVDVVKK